MSSAASPPVKQAYPWILGGIATGMASTCTHPLDLVKASRMQTLEGSRGLIGTFGDVLNAKGLRGLFDGLSAAWYRGMTYSLARFEAYAVAKRYIERNRLIDSNFGTSIAAGGFAGVVGGFVANPGDIVLIRMQSDYSKPLAERFGYTNVIQGLWRVAADEGPRYLFRGLGTTIFRALLTNIGQLASYDIFKENLLRYDIVGDNPACHFLASFGAGTFATTISQPADVVRSRLMATHGGNTNPIAITKQLVAQGGLRSLFKGWVPAWYRQTPQTILTFLFLEQLRNLVDTYRSKRELSPVVAVLK